MCYGASTGVSRTKMSLQLILAGLWPPQGTDLEWNKNLNWQPITFDYQPLTEDNVTITIYFLGFSISSPYFDSSYVIKTAAGTFRVVIRKIKITNLYYQTILTIVNGV